MLRWSGAKYLIPQCLPQRDAVVWNAGAVARVWAWTGGAGRERGACAGGRARAGSSGVVRSVSAIRELSLCTSWALNPDPMSSEHKFHSELDKPRVVDGIVNASKVR
jgi:hypothetical protein